MYYVYKWIGQYDGVISHIIYIECKLLPIKFIMNVYNQHAIDYYSSLDRHMLNDYDWKLELFDNMASLIQEYPEMIMNDVYNI